MVLSLISLIGLGGIINTYYTKKAMAPPPKVTLNFTFAKASIDDPPLRRVTLPVKDDVVHVEFGIKNDTDIDAVNGIITLEICKSCKFAKEPPKFYKVPGQTDITRTMSFDNVRARSESETLSADIKVPPDSTSVEFGVTYRCNNCIVPEQRDNVGKIFLSR